MSAWVRRKPRASKYGNQKVSSLCFFGFSHRSKLERAVCDLIAWEQRGGITEHVAHEVHLTLGPCGHTYVADFQVRDMTSGETYWIEAKGDEGAGQWPATKRHWKIFGPGRLVVFGGDYRRPVRKRELVSEGRA